MISDSRCEEIKVPNRLTDRSNAYDWSNLDIADFVWSEWSSSTFGPSVLVQDRWDEDRYLSQSLFLRESWLKCAELHLKLWSIFGEIRENTGQVDYLRRLLTAEKIFKFFEWLRREEFTIGGKPATSTPSHKMRFMSAVFGRTFCPIHVIRRTARPVC